MTRMLHSILTTSFAPAMAAATPIPQPSTVSVGGSPSVGISPVPVSIRAAMWDDSAWREKAACHDIDTNTFFPVGLTGSSIEQTNRAKTICRSCPAQPACLEFALRTNQDHGIWGAHTEEERRALRRARRAAARRALAAERAAAERMAEQAAQGPGRDERQTREAIAV